MFRRILSCIDILKSDSYFLLLEYKDGEYEAQGINDTDNVRKLEKFFRQVDKASKIAQDYLRNV